MKQPTLIRTHVAHAVTTNQRAASMRANVVAARGEAGHVVSAADFVITGDGYVTTGDGRVIYG